MKQFSRLHYSSSAIWIIKYAFAGFKNPLSSLDAECYARWESIAPTNIYATCPAKEAASKLVLSDSQIPVSAVGAKRT